MTRGPVLVYDGDCAFCTSCVRFIEKRLPTRADLVTWQGTDLAAYGVTVQRAAYELLWIAPDGRVDGGAQAVASLLLDSGGVWRLVGAALRVVPLRWLAHLGYRFVANNRGRLPGGTPACALPADQRPGAGGKSA
jgi:predicted DCC family thiol-disulfide oxidoreductase YuxK